MELFVDIEKRLGDFLLQVTFTAGNEVFGILGASGCGKSMTLKCIAGIETPDRGTIRLNGKILFDSDQKINLPARVRNVGYLFQDYALFPHMTVRQNLMCGIRNTEPGSRKEKKAADHQKVDSFINKFYLKEQENLYPAQLSGGQKQRTALARMLMGEPEMLMLDEPFSALDPYLKWQLEQEIMKITESLKQPVLFVSHNRDEIFRLTHRVGVMDTGKLADIQSKQELFGHPGTLAAALLTGCKNITALEPEGADTYYASDWGIMLKTTAGKQKNPIYAGFRAHYFEITGQMEPVNVFDVEILRVIEDTFSVILLFRQRGHVSQKEWSVLRFELPKEMWKLWQNRPFYLKIPGEQIILLEQ